MEHNFQELIRQKSERDKEKSKKYRDSSKERLNNIANKKIKTTMIGALDTIETHFGFLWNDNPGSEQAIYMKEVYERAREEILNNGNNQIRNLSAEMEQYDIEWNRYHMELPVKPLPGGRNE